MGEQLVLGQDAASLDTGTQGHVPKADAGPVSAEAGAAATGNDTGYLRMFVFALFFFFGGITSLNDVIIPKLKELFTLSYAEVMTVQSAFFGAYFIISLPAAAVVRRIGYMRSAVVGLLLMMIGCLLFIPASSSAVFQDVLGGAVHRGRGHHGGAGGRESADLAPRTAGDGAQPAHVRTGVQFARHDRLSVRGLGVDPRLIGDDRPENSHGRRA